MNEVDRQYQQVVDDLANEYRLRSIEELSLQPDFGSIAREIDGHDFSVAFWHYRLRDDINHIVFITERKLLVPIFSRKFINGVVFGPTINVRLMTNEEIVKYD